MFEVAQITEKDFGGEEVVAPANERFKKIFEEMHTIIAAGGCRPESKDKASRKLYHLGNQMISTMMIPLMKKLIHSIVQADQEKIKLYALSIVPQMFACKPSVANILMNKLYDFDYKPEEQDEIVTMLQSTYNALGFTCEDIGAYRDIIPQCQEEPIMALAGYQ